MKFKIAALAALLFSSGVALADNNAASAVVIDNVPKFLDHQRDLRDELESPKFRHIGSTNRQKLLAAQDELFVLLDGKRSVEELTHEQRIKVYNAQHLIAGIITNAELDRPICKREKRVGSNMAQTVCTTKRQKDAHYDDLQRNMKAPRNCGGPDCSANRG